MLTRRKQKKTEKDTVRATRRIMVRALPQRFLNPSKTYKIFDVSATSSILRTFISMRSS